jgi:hypothetical protein
MDNFLLDRVIANGLKGRLKYRINLWEDQNIVFENLSVMENILGDKIPELSSKCLKYYTSNYEYIIELMFNKSNAIIGFEFGTNNRSNFVKIRNQLQSIGIKANRESNNNEKEYLLYKDYCLSPMLEILPGQYNDVKNRNTGESIFLSQDAVLNFTDLLVKVNKDFDYYGISTEFNREQINALIEELKNRLDEMKNNRAFSFARKGNLDYYETINVKYRKYRPQIIRMLTELIEWLSGIRNDKISILGI